MTTHNPAPFDFVPFSVEEPVVKKQDQWEQEGGALLSGHIEYALTALSPIHIVGKQDRSGYKSNYQIARSHFNRRAGRATIPGTSIKGTVRSFFEALTNSWVGQATEEQESKKNEQRIGFAAVGKPKGALSYRYPQKKTFDCGPAIPKRFHPTMEEKNVDLASFLFGVVFEGDKKKAKSGNDGEKENDDVAYRSRVIFEDVEIDEKDAFSDVQLPDIPGLAFMGGPKPRMNNWWYFKPAAICKHKSSFGRGRLVDVADFIGVEFWGRKFYYHQNPEHCVRWYEKCDDWPKNRGFYKYPAESMRQGNACKGRIYFERVPENILALFLSCLESRNTKIKHKIGYGQPYGLGSFDLKIAAVKCVSDDNPFSPESDYDFQSATATGLAEENPVVNANSLTWLKLILGYDENQMKESNYVFTYPPFNAQNFMKVVRWDELIKKIAPGEKEANRIDNIPVNLQQAMKVAEVLYKSNIKRTVNFRFYQESSNLWGKILDHLK